ncbi:GNAT family N-acetyltransferase [Streptomyces sp. NPDC002896]|uniref:GNAT family N-acetyltransferase n=1 Tax=Streptomyces sp. NPDC002896 TaxID=3154438 RepID=UPI00331EBE4A
MRVMGGDQVDEAVACAVEALRPAAAASAGRDWTVRAGRLEWSCRYTAEHMASDLIAYAGQLAGRATEAYVPFEITLDEGTDNEGVLRVIEATGGLLSAAVRTTPANVRAFHPYPFRSAGPEGFAAMGITEVLVHTHDIAQGLGLTWEPPAALCEAVLTRIFPHVQPGPDHWRTLLWATGRGDLPYRAPLTEWRWNNTVHIPAGRIALHGITPAAAADLHTGGTGGFDWTEGGPYEGTRTAAGLLIKAYTAGSHRPEWGVFAIVRHDDGRAIGGIGFHSTPDDEGNVEVGYDLVEGARGHGYATEALRALAGWALARPEAKTLHATVDRTNTASQAVVSRAGFTRVGERDDNYTYELRA